MNRYILFVGSLLGSGLINAYSHKEVKSLDEAREYLSDLYKDTFWQEHPDVIGIYELVTEENGYQHTGEEITRWSAKDFLGKKLNLVNVSNLLSFLFAGINFSAYLYQCN